MSSYLLEKFEMDFAPYRKALVALGEADPRVIVLGADLANSTEIDGFYGEFPQRFFNIGAAEQNMIGIATGLALEGEIPFAHSFGVFSTRRIYDQICVQVAMQRANVKIIGAIPGLTSRLGPTHQAIDDLGLMRLLPNMVVIDPADATEIEMAVPAIASYEGPVYMRMMRREVPVLFDRLLYKFEIGRALLIRDGSSVGLISCGMMIKEAYSASISLSKRGIDSALLHVSTLKPIDEEAVISLARKTGALVTVENHLISGGLGSAVLEVLAGRFPVPIERIGLRDQFAEPGTPEYLFKKYGLTERHIVDAALKVIKNKKDGRLVKGEG